MSVYFANNPAGEFQGCTLSPPLYKLPGDDLVQVGSVLNQVRGGLVIHSWNLDNPVEFIPPENNAAETITTFVFFKERPMPGVMLTTQKTTRNDLTGEITKEYSDGTGRTFASWSEMGNAKGDIDSQKEFLKDIMDLLSFRRDPTGSNITNFDLGSVAADFNAANPIIFGFPE